MDDLEFVTCDHPYHDHDSLEAARKCVRDENVIIVTVILTDEVEPTVYHFAHKDLARHFVDRVHNLAAETGIGVLVETHEPTEIVGQNGLDECLADLRWTMDNGL